LPGSVWQGQCAESDIILPGIHIGLLDPTQADRQRLRCEDEPGELHLTKVKRLADE